MHNSVKEEVFSCESVDHKIFLILLRTENDRSTVALEHGIHTYILKTIKTLGKVNAKRELNNFVNKPFIVKSSFENEIAIFFKLDFLFNK